MNTLLVEKAWIRYHTPWLTRGKTESKQDSSHFREPTEYSERYEGVAEAVHIKAHEGGEKKPRENRMSRFEVQTECSKRHKSVKDTQHTHYGETQLVYIKRKG